jgi:deazaflavin-dependent oxidoreductase (nitroreductase family)
MADHAHYRRPSWLTTNVINRIVAGLTRLGVSVLGSRVLEVRGRRSGQWRRNPVNLLVFEGERYLVAPRGHTQWARNLRASGEGNLLLGRRREPFTATELPADDTPPLLRAYLRRWKAETGVFFGGVGPDSSDMELRRIAPDHPVFRLGRSVRPSLDASPLFASRTSSRPCQSSGSSRRRAGRRRCWTGGDGDVTDVTAAGWRFTMWSGRARSARCS